MKILYRRCAGLDIHKKTVAVCVRMRVDKGQVVTEHAVFGTFTQDLERLREWLKERKVKQIAMESTGVYWIPVWNVLEPVRWRFDLLLVNPQLVRALPGRKTDQQDCERIAELAAVRPASWQLHSTEADPRIARLDPAARALAR